MKADYDLIIAGTGFASSFFLLQYLKSAKRDARVLVLERGEDHSHAWQLKHQKNSATPSRSTYTSAGKPVSFQYNIGFGGGSNCWWANTHRMLPNDFRMKTQYGVAEDWPISYTDLAPHYDQAMEIMSLSGPDDMAIYPDKVQFPQGPHDFSDPDRLVKNHYPDLYFHAPSARASQATKHRSSCCNSGSCNLCPVNAKFSVLNELSHIYKDPRVTLKLNARIERVGSNADLIDRVEYTDGTGRHSVRGELVALGCNAIMNAFILLRSGMTHPVLGRYLSKQPYITATIDLAGLDSFQASSSISAIGYMLYDGAHRTHQSACMIQNNNVISPSSIRHEEGKWRQRIVLTCDVEDLPNVNNQVRVGTNDPTLPEIVYGDVSDYVTRRVRGLEDTLRDVFSCLPIERIQMADRVLSYPNSILGSTRMGFDAEDSLIDRHLVHHRYRNLVLLGGGAFPSVSPSHPTCTVSALSLWSAAHLFN